ncbi:FRG domain-containing protein [Herbaspirillum lusitanum]|uniref:FRG domain-containing protein n=1 Tax=Herbaspirillum lusitanum TaxID=213312 RepID=A0ABW9AEF1_9BURK
MPSANVIDEVVLSSWSEFAAASDQLDGWVFRGQADQSWPLVSSLTRHLARYCPDPSLWPLREDRAIRVFRRKAHVFLQDASVLEDDLRCLALMQHHGAPTRLVDFTKSPFVAAFFALQQLRADSAAVFALNTPALWKVAPRFDAALNREAIDLRKPGSYQKYFAGNSLPLVWFGEPNQMDARLVAQSGILVVPGKLEAPLDLLLGEYESDEPLIRKFILPASVRGEALRALYRMNITAATLFPDLDGLARSIDYELETVWEQLIVDYRSRPTKT